MAKTAVMLDTIQISGDGETNTIVLSNAPNGNAPPPATFLLANGAFALTLPSSTTYSYTMVKLIPPPGSTNVKTIKGNVSDTGLGPWTVGPVTLPVGTTIVIASSSAETLQVVPV